MSALAQLPLFLTGVGMIQLWPFKFIGFSYAAALDLDTSFFLNLIGFTFGVGFCKELCKAIPVVYYIRRNKNVNWHGAYLWGLASGAGFGISEGISYSADFYNGIEAGDVYFVRFLSCVALHALWSGTVAITLYLFRGKYYRSLKWSDRFAFVLMACAIPIALHGFFDTFLKKEMHLAALPVALLSFAFPARLDHFLHSIGGVSFLRETGTRNRAA
jgi:RsiW-degrading membrane proteinase PrsW (M82 family)